MTLPPINRETATDIVLQAALQYERENPFFGTPPRLENLFRGTLERMTTIEIVQWAEHVQGGGDVFYWSGLA
jgi:hypothetical protein